MTDRTPPLDEWLPPLRAQVLADGPLSRALASHDDPGPFCATIAGLASGLGFNLDTGTIQNAMRASLPGRSGMLDSGDPLTPPPPAGWLPVRTNWHSGTLHLRWAYLGQTPLMEPFFEESAQRALSKPFSRLFRPTTPIGALEDWVSLHKPIPPRGFIFHMSRCGSTLVSRALAAMPRHVTISEAAPLDTVVRARTECPALPATLHDSWLRWMAGALGQPRRGGEDAVFIKTDPWHAAALPLFRRVFPGVPWVFLYRDPIEVLVSHDSMPGMHTVPGLLDGGVLGPGLPFDPAHIEDYAARVLARICEPALTAHLAAHADGGLLVNYRDLPGAIWTRILPHFRIVPNEMDRAAIAAAAAVNAKSPGEAFVPDSEAKQHAASPAIRRAAAAHLADVYRRLEEASRPTAAPDA